MGACLTILTSIVFFFQTCESPQIERRKSLGQAWITSESLVQTRSGMVGTLPSDSTPMACLPNKPVAERTNEWFAHKIEGAKTSFNQDSTGVATHRHKSLDNLRTNRNIHNV